MWASESSYTKCDKKWGKSYKTLEKPLGNKSCYFFFLLRIKILSDSHLYSSYFVISKKFYHLFMWYAFATITCSLPATVLIVMWGKAITFHNLDIQTFWMTTSFSLHRKDHNQSSGSINTKVRTFHFLTNGF